MTDRLDQPLARVLRTALGDRLASDAANFLDMCANDIIFEFPFAPDAGVHRLNGKAALSAYLPRVGSLIAIDDASVEAVHQAGPDVTIIEFSIAGRGVETGLAYDQHYVSVVRTRDGRIVHYRDYWNPLILLQAVGGDEAMAAALAGSRK